MAGSRSTNYVDSDDCLLEYSYLFSPDLLRGKVAFITGGGSGIGFRIAEIFMRHGCNVAIGSRNTSRVEIAAKKLVQVTGGRCLSLCMDVRHVDEVSSAVEETVASLGLIDILVNNAAGNFLCPASSLSSKGFRTVMEIDTLGTFNTTKAVYERCFKARGGIVVNLTATLGLRGQVMQVHAGCAKAAIDAMTRHLAVEWGPDAVRVNSLAPGPIEETEGMRRLGGTWARSAGLFQKLPLGRAGSKLDVAHAALFLASPAADYITGITLLVDGGSWLTTPNAFPDILPSAKL
uniref:peroxisomal 2,4-dienoyl-CoA reductase [(3E)-enoyl-CoA-producing] isoform X2 n=1 Tax=Myxine glutinosa TaxID=7769 RepID=UPI00358FB9F8